MTDIMFELPEIETKGKYVVTEEVVRGEAKLFEQDDRSPPTRRAPEDRSRNHESTKARKSKKAGATCV